MRQGEVETIAYNRDKGIGVTVYVGQRRGQASTADFSDDAIRAAVDKALAIARYTAEDPAAGLADPDRLAKHWTDLDLYHPWALAVEQAIELGREAERAALAVDKRITNTEGATVARGDSEFVYANTQRLRRRLPQLAPSHRRVGDRRGRRRACSATTGTRRRASPRELLPAAEVGRIAGERTVRRLNARKLGTLECPVLFEAPEAADLIGCFVHAVSGGSLYRKSSFLLDSLGHSGVLAASCRSARSRTFRARAAARRSTPKVSRRAARRRSRRRARRLFPRQLLGAQARHDDDRQRRRQPQPRRCARRRRPRRRCCAHGARPARHRAARAGRQPRDRRLFARRGGLLGRERRDRVSGRGDHDRRQPEGHLPRHRRRRPRRRPARLASRRLDPGRPDDGRGR